MSCRLICKSFDIINISCSETFLSEYIDFSISLIYLAQKPFRANILIFWFYQYILLGNLFEQIYQFFDFINISCPKTFPSKYISIFWFYWYILLGNLFEQIYRFFDFTDISRLKTFPSEYIDILILLLYLAQKLFRANIPIFWF